MTDPTDPQQTPPNDLGAAGHGDLAALARETVTDSESAVVRPSAPGPAAGPVDRWGRSFDPALHMVRGDGSPRLRGGTLIVKNRALGAFEKPVPRAARPAPGGDHLDTSGLGDDLAGAAAAGDNHGADLPGGEDEQHDLDPPVTEAEASADAQALADGLEIVGQAANPDDGSMQADERQAIELRWKNVLTRYQLRLPVGQVFLALLATGRYTARVASKPKTRERVGGFIAWLTGRERPQPAPVAAPGQNVQPAPNGKTPPRQIPEDYGL